MAKPKKTPGKSRKAPPVAASPPRRIWLLVLPAIVLVTVAASYLPFLSDDALISLRYAQRLLDGDGLTWTDGERVEGYSNLLWILASALLGGIGFDLVTAVRVLGFAGSLAVLGALVRGYPPGRSGLAPSCVAGFMLATSGTIGVWAVGGLEQPLLVGLLAWALVTAYPLLEGDAAPAGLSSWTPGVLLALVAWTRPDGILFAVAAVVGLFAARGRAASAGIALRLAAPALGAVALQTAFRLAYYGAWLPNTAGAKLSVGGRRLAEGAAYLGLGALWLAPLLLAAAGFAVAARTSPRTSRRLRFLFPAVVLWSAYVVAIGGDLFPARRHLAPIVVLLALVLAEALDGLRERGVARYRHAVPVGVAAALLLAGLQHSDPANRRARLERWEWDGEIVGNMLRRGFPERPLLAVDPAGTLPYFSELPAIDMLGLTDRYLATHRPADFGKGHLGHELGDGGYVLDREPDLVVFCGPAGGEEPCFPSGRQMLEDPRFLERYVPVTFQGTGTRRTGPFGSAGESYLFRSRIWVRREGGRIGIHREGEQVIVPSYLMTRIGDPVAKLEGPGQFVVAVGGRGAAGIDRVPLPPGTWSVRVEADGPPLRTMVRMSDNEQMLAGGLNGTDPFVIRGEEGSLWPVDVLTLPNGPEGEALVKRLVFTRHGPA